MRLIVKLDSTEVGWRVAGTLEIEVLDASEARDWGDSYAEAGNVVSAEMLDVARDMVVDAFADVVRSTESGDCPNCGHVLHEDCDACPSTVRNADLTVGDCGCRGIRRERAA